MGDAGKHSHDAIMASDLKTLFPAIGTRRTKVFTYGFVMAFVACTIFLAFSPSGNASPWFNNLFTSSSSISTSFQPYRSQFSSFVFYLFPNSSASSPQTPIPPQKPPNLVDSRAGPPGNLFPVADRKGKGVGFQKDGTFGGNGSSGNGVPAKNQTGTGSENNGADDKKDGVLSGEKLNQTVSGSGLPGTGVSEKNQTPKPVNAREIGNSAKNPSGGNGSENIPVLIGKNQTVSGHGIGVSVKDQAGGNVNVAGSGLQGSGVPMAEKKQTGHEVSANIQNGSNAGGASAENRKKSETPAADHKGDTTGGKGSNFTASAKKPSDAIASKGDDQKKKEWIENMVGCDLFHGHWVRDESYPLYSEGSCPHIDEPFDCYHNGRPDRTYQQLRWQPSGCNIPRLNATDMLERLRGKRLVFVGDSLNRNMWESLVCVLRNSVKDKKKVFEMSGKHEFKTEGSYSFLFKDYGCTVEFFRSPFLVQEWEMPGNNGTKKETLRLDLVEKSASKYKDAHVIIFNTGHWWTHEKTSKGKDYYQEGNKIYDELDVADAFHKALHTWAKWIDANVNPKKSLVFFRGYSASHFRGGQWNSGGQCDRETEPIKNEAYLSSYPPKMSILETVIKEMKTHVSYLNITRMTDYRKDAHPSIYREPNMTDEERRAPDSYQDCSHWCLPGVPDTWNELLYATLLIKQHEMLH